MKSQIFFLGLVCLTVVAQCYFCAAQTSEMFVRQQSSVAVHAHVTRYRILHHVSRIGDRCNQFRYDKVRLEPLLEYATRTAGELYRIVSTVVVHK